ncbi:matrix-remodeling-associated protein 5-like [Periophthalmus magnuspinnatus]|uniref:matrix-remodeling-associated protein 5-like n=1 Tax=Periophthalmus magnuspinnatus TaxID=409849 RepID=UPI0024371F84|nr:matrix-remodeling-associated protein 5-like [Periophthalmus magnuspinnatus]
MSGTALLLPLLLLSLLSIALVRSCPRSCNCYQASEVHCTFRSLQTVPSGLPPHTRRINLGFNSIHLLQNSSLSGLKNLELLMLHSNHLQQIPPGVFSDMKNLQILKLSYNKLEELWSEHTFSGLSSLTRLYLDHNQLRWIHPRALLLLPRLRLLKLQGNRLLQLHPQALCTLSVLETYCYSTLRHLDLSNNSLSTVAKELLETAPLLETLVLHANPWSCDCGMNWLLDWTVSNPGVMKCPGSPQCPVCASPLSLQHQGLLDQPNLPCSAPLISSPGRNTPLDPSDIPEILPRQSFRESLGTLSLSLADQQGFNVDVTCNVSQTYTSPDISSALASFQSFPLSLALSFSLECYAERQNYEKLWRIMAYYSESAARLERGLMLSKAPTLAYRYRQAPETEGEYHTGVKASMAASPHWLLQPAVSIQLNRAKSNRKAVHLVLSTRVSAHSDLATSRPWVLISTNRTVKGLSALAGSTVELPCPILSSGGHKVEWIFPDGSKIIPSSSSSNSRWKVLSSGLTLQKLELSDAGLYYCKASNGKDTDILPLQLVVIELPASATRESVELSGVIGQPITISCNASGSPPPFTSWLLPNGNLLRHGSALSGGVTMEANGSLSLPKPSLRNAGHYRCIVVNQYGSDSLSTQLELKPLQTPPLKTTFPRRPQSAAGRSTKIRAPLLRSDEGSGDGAEEEEEEEESVVRNRRPFLNNQRRRGPGRTGLVNERRNRLGGRHRVAPNRQRIDPKKWADLLAKIREKAITASDNQPAESTEKSESKVNEEVESSSGDDTRMFEETVYPAKSQTNMETDGSSRINEATTKFKETTSQEPHEIATTHGQWITTTTPATSTTTPTTSMSIQDAMTTTKPLMTTSEIVPKVAESHSRYSIILFTFWDNQGTGLPQNFWLPDDFKYSQYYHCNKDYNCCTYNSFNFCNTSGTRDRPMVYGVDPRQRLIPGTPQQSRPPTDWRKPGSANSIPDSQSSRTHLPPPASLPISPRLPIPRSRPRISDPHIRSVSYPAEGTAWLHCEAEGEPKPAITWTKVSTGAVMSVSSRAQRLEVLPNGTLVIQSLQLQDRGTYICSAHSYMGRDRLLATLDVWTRPPRMQLPSYRELTTHQGGDLSMDCRAEGVPSPLLSWVLPDRSVLSTSRSSNSPSNAPRFSLDTNGTLHLSAALPTDRGMYRCVASNSAGAASASVRIHVSSLPPVIQQPKEEAFTLSPGMPLYAHCSARGAPNPSLRWKIPSGIYVRPSQYLHGNLFVLPNGTLHIVSMGSKDTGTYECTASNAVGMEKRVVRVQLGGNVAAGNQIVTEQYSSAAHKDKTQPKLDLENSLNATEVAASSPIERPRTVIQTISANTLPKISFTPSPKRFTGAVGNDARPAVEDSRKIASSSEVFPESSSRVPLKVSPVAQFTKAQIVSTSPSLSTVQVGERMDLHCQVTGHPPPNVIWRTPSRKLVDVHFSFDGHMRMHPNGTLSVGGVTERDGGDYLCIARNKVGDDYRLVRVTVAPKPAQQPARQPDLQPASRAAQQPARQPAAQPDLQPASRATQQPARHPATQPDRQPGPQPAQQPNFQPATQPAHHLRPQPYPYPYPQPARQPDHPQPAHPQPALQPAHPQPAHPQPAHPQPAHPQPARPQPATQPALLPNRQPAPQPARQPAPHPAAKPASIQQKQPVNQLVSLGKTLRVDCLASGHPEPSVRWSLPDGTIVSSTFQGADKAVRTRRLTVFNNGTLLVAAVGRGEEGEYTCYAENQAGRDTMKVKVKIMPSSSPPTFEDDSAYSVVKVQLGTTAKLPCAPTGDPAPSVTWFSPMNRVIPWTSRSGFYTERVVVSGGTLELRIAQKQDTGNYTCQASNAAGTRSKVVRLEVEVPSAIRNSVPGNHVLNGHVRGVTTQLGRSVVSVGVSGTGNVGFRAENSAINRNNIGVNSNKLASRPGAVLNVETNHNEVVASKPSNDANRRDIDISSSVANTGLRNSVAGNVSLSQGVVLTVKQQVIKGQSVFLHCPAGGSWTPRLTWLLPGNTALGAPHYGSRLTVHRNGTLELRGVSGADQGRFVCVVRGDRGETRLQVELEVREEPHRVEPHPGSPVDQRRAQISPRPVPRTPTSLLSIASRTLSSEQVVSTKTAALVSIINGETLHLPCSAPHSPAHSQGPVSWSLPNGQRLSSSERQGLYSVQTDGTLTVQQASVFDRGTYTCRFSAPSGVVEVTVPVIVIAYPPRITTGPAPVTYTRPGVAVELPCLAIATPRATITWEMPDMSKLTALGQARIYGNRYLSPQGSLVIQSPSSRDTGFYRCTAKNVIGADTKATYLHVI